MNADVIRNLLSDPQQKLALEMVARQALNIISGGPGTGKTYTLAHMIAVAVHEALPNIRIAMAAPTGKAAQRMKEALQKALHSEALQEFELEQLKQLQPVTLHRLLGLGTRGQPRFHAKQPLPYDVDRGRRSLDAGFKPVTDVTGLRTMSCTADFTR